MDAGFIDGLVHSRLFEDFLHRVGVIIIASDIRPVFAEQQSHALVLDDGFEDARWEARTDPIDPLPTIPISTSLTLSLSRSAMLGLAGE